MTDGRRRDERSGGRGGEKVPEATGE